MRFRRSLPSSVKVMGFLTTGAWEFVHDVKIECVQAPFGLYWSGLPCLLCSTRHSRKIKKLEDCCNSTLINYQGATLRSSLHLLAPNISLVEG